MISDKLLQGMCAQVANMAKTEVDPASRLKLFGAELPPDIVEAMAFLRRRAGKPS